MIDPAELTDTRSPGTDLDYLQKLEALASAAADFCRRTAATIFALFVRPRRLLREGPQPDHAYLPPRSFLVLSTFLSTSTVRVLIIALRMVVAAAALSAAESCTDSREFQPLVRPGLTEILTMPSLVEITFIGLPTLAAVAFLSRAIGRALAARSDQTAAALGNSAFYIIGFQQILFTVVLAPVVGLYMLSTAPSMLEFGVRQPDPEQIELKMALGLLVAPFITITWPTVLLARFALSVVIPTGPRLSRVLRASFGSLLVCLLSAAVMAGTAYPFALHDLAGRDQLRTYLDVRADRDATALRTDSSAAFAVINRSRETLVLLDGGAVLRVNVQKDRGYFVQYVYDAEITAWNDRRSRICVLRPGEAATLWLRVGIRGDSSAAAGPGYVLQIWAVDHNGGFGMLRRTVALAPHGG